MTILINEDITLDHNNNKPIKLKKIMGNNIVVAESISNEDPFDSLKQSMREDSWYWDYNHDY